MTGGVFPFCTPRGEPAAIIIMTRSSRAPFKQGGNRPGILLFSGARCAEDTEYYCVQETFSYRGPHVLESQARSGR